MAQVLFQGSPGVAKWQELYETVAAISVGLGLTTASDTIDTLLAAIATHRDLEGA